MRLRVLTAGLAGVASSEAARELLGRLGLGPCESPVEGLRILLRRLGVRAEVEDGEELRVIVRQPCPFSLERCEEICPLPHISATYLSTATGRWWGPRRVDRLFVKRTGEECEYRLSGGRAAPKP
ncbi:MAG: hypothetical protein J7L75_00605 [Thermoproteales archaeon]|nr:hypothetical protein [Thermoproteales archaeon]